MSLCLTAQGLLSSTDKSLPGSSSLPSLRGRSHSLTVASTPPERGRCDDLLHALRIRTITLLFLVHTIALLLFISTMALSISAVVPRAVVYDVPRLGGGVEENAGLVVAVDSGLDVMGLLRMGSGQTVWNRRRQG